MKRGRLKEPLLNTSKEAVALRRAADDFVVHAIRDGVRSSDDIEGQRRNIALLKAARTYAAAVTARDYRLDAPKKRARKKKETWSCTCTAVVPCDGHRRESIG